MPHQHEKNDTTETSRGELWHEVRESFKRIIDDEEWTLLAACRTEKENVVFIGSSSVKGQGPTDINNAYVYRLKTALAAASPVIGVENRGIGGDDTTEGMARFDDDVIDDRPTIVFIAFTLGNEGWVAGGGIGPNFVAYDSLRKNLFRLAARCQAHGMFPIFVSQFANSRYDADYLFAAKQFNRELQRSDIPVIDLMGGLLDQSTGQLYANAKPGTDMDHHNDLGHQVDFEAINQSMISHYSATRRKVTIPSYIPRRGAVRYPATAISDNTAGDAIIFFPEQTVGCFTVFHRIKAFADIAAASTLTGIGSGGWRVVNVADVATAIVQFKKADGSTFATSTVDLNDNLEHSIAVTFNKIPTGGLVRFYVDGNLVASGTGTITLDQLGLGCRGTGTIYPTNMEYWDCAVYRTSLLDDQIKEMHRGTFNEGSLELFCPMNDVEIGNLRRFQNYAPTTSKLKIRTGQLVVV